GDTAATGKHRSWRIRDVLAAAQIALSLVLLIGTGLCLRSLAELQTTNPGFDMRNLVLVPMEFKESTEASVGPAYEELARRLESIPGIRQVSYTRVLPMLGGKLFVANEAIRRFATPEGGVLEGRLSLVGPGY